jgi:adenine-specific DNA-methyltransferase
MTKVFVGGSRHASRLNAQVRDRLDNIIKSGFPVVVGDANGADKAIQQYLHSKHYQNVEVFCSNGICRNNIGGWRSRNVPTESRERNAQFYSAKDRAMAQEATIGLMMWDGKSVGTLLNVFRLLSFQKKAIVYAVPEKRFLEFRSDAEWKEFVASRDTALRRKIEERAQSEMASKSHLLQTTLFN